MSPLRRPGRVLMLQNLGRAARRRQQAARTEIVRPEPPRVSSDRPDVPPAAANDETPAN